MLLVKYFYNIKILRTCRNFNGSGERCCKREMIFPFFFLFFFFNKQRQKIRKNPFRMEIQRDVNRWRVAVRGINHRRWVFAYLFRMYFSRVPTSRFAVRTINSHWHAIVRYIRIYYTVIPPHWYRVRSSQNLSQTKYTQCRVILLYNTVTTL